MPPFATLRTRIDGLFQAYRKAVAYRTVASLPDHLRKDIGWPAPDRIERGR